MRRASTFGSSSKALRRARPFLEGLEERLALSQTTGGLSVVVAASPAGGVFRHNFQEFFYTTPQGTRVQLKVVGRGSLEGSTVDSSGALHLLFSKTNSYTRIMSSVHGGTGQAPLASIYSRDLFINDASGSLSGIGASVLHSINLPNFNLIAGGVIDVTSGIASLSLNSAGPSSQIELRELPAELTAGQSSDSTAAGLTNSFVTGAFQVQGLANINGEFLSAGTIVNVTADPTDPGPAPAPPGIVLKVNHIRGNVSPVPNLLYDNMVFGYDPATGRVLRFLLQPTTNSSGQPNMAQQVGTVDQSFTPLQVQPAGSTNPIALSVGNDGNRRVLLVSNGSQISVYDATYGTSLGSFAAPPQFSADAMGSTSTLTILGYTASNPLANPFDPLFNHMVTINVAASLRTGQAKVLATTPTSIPAAGVLLLGGLTGLPGSNQAYATVEASFNPLLPGIPQVGLLAVTTTTSTANSNGELVLSNGFQSVAQKAFTVNGAYIPVGNPQGFGSSMGSVDSNLAFNTVNTTATSGPVKNTVLMYGPSSQSLKGSITLQYPNQLSDLSESFRSDLNGSAANGTGPVLIDVQGNIQSLRGISANGLVLNNTGYLHLIRTGAITNSTILAQPVGHVLTPASHRINTTIWSSSNRSFGTRGGVRLVSGLYQLGPLSLTNDKPSI